MAGLDEVGRGALAGPVTAAICVLKDRELVKEVRDSKMLSEKKRKKLARLIKNRAKGWAIAFVSSSEIEKLGIQQATYLAFRRAIQKLTQPIDYLLVDAYRVPQIKIPQKALKKGDQICLSIAAASVLAKVARDELMRKMAQKYSGYYFEKNKGYGTKEHLAALEKLGPSPIHRRNFQPIKEKNESKEPGFGSQR